MNERLLLAYFASFSILSGSPSSSPVYSIEINGMRCDACARKLRRRLCALPGIAQADVSLEDHRAFLTLREDEALDETCVKIAVRSAGYFAREIHLSIAA